MTMPTISTMEELVCDQCNEFIQNGSPFSAVAVTEALKLKELRNPTNGVDIRHRHVNDLVRAYMAQIANTVNYSTTITQPTVDAQGRPIHAPDGVYVYHPPTFDATNYLHPSLTKPLSMQGAPVSPVSTVALGAPVTPMAIVQGIWATSTPIKSTLPLVSVRYTMTDDNPRNEETHIFRATFSKKEASEKNVYDAIIKKIEEKILDPQGLGFNEQDENLTYMDLSFDKGDELDVPIIIYLKYNDENDKTQENSFISLDEFDKEYGFQRWQELEAARKPKPNDDDDDDSVSGSLISTLPNASKGNLPDLHLPIYNDGRVGIPSGVIRGLNKDAIVIMTGDVPSTVKFIPLQDYLSTQV